eukprot:TRINITY_DN11481_c0_g1_i1.p1 TRINITY_DN11481_c0_g1~~TRINITY_DN11481_c0_g1_i1.p1  ORF type:complete len:777 (-),score=153.63 TRINITY_DN11481_c0_g1_i1:224-2554(-)
MTRPPAMPSRFPSRAAARAGRARLQGEGHLSSAGTSRGSSAASSSRPDSALRDYAQTAISRAIYRHAREYLPGIAEANPGYSPFWRVLCAVRKGARAVILETSVIRAFSDAVDEKRQMLAKRADSMWRTLLSQVECVFKCDVGAEDVTTAAKEVASALAEMLAGFEGGDAVQDKFLGMADTFRESEASLRHLAKLLEVDLSGFQDMQGTIEQCVLEAARIIGLFEDHVSALRLQLNQTLQSPKRQLTGRPFSGPADNQIPQVAISSQNPHTEDHISKLLRNLQRDLCDKPMMEMVATAEAVVRKIAPATLQPLLASNTAGSIDHDVSKHDMLGNALAVPTEGTAMVNAQEGSGPEAPAGHGPAKIVLDLAKQMQLQTAQAPGCAGMGYPTTISAEFAACATHVASPSKINDSKKDAEIPVLSSSDQTDVAEDDRFEMTINPSRQSMLAEFEDAQSFAQVIINAENSFMAPAKAYVLDNCEEDREKNRQDSAKDLVASSHSAISCPSNVIGIQASNAATNFAAGLKTEECEQEHVSLEASIDTQDIDPWALLIGTDSLASLSGSAALPRYNLDGMTAADEPTAAGCAPMRSATGKPSMQCDLSRNDEAYNSKSATKHVREQHREHNLGALPGHGPRRPDHYMNYMGPKAAASRAATKSRNRIQVPPPPPSYVQESPSRAMLSRRLAPLARESSETEPLGADVSSSAAMFDCRQHPHMDIWPANILPGLKWMGPVSTAWCILARTPGWTHASPRGVFEAHDLLHAQLLPSFLALLRRL